MGIGSGFVEGHDWRGDPFVYVDCGARGESTQPLVEMLPHALYVGFEADSEECARLRERATPSYTYFPVAVAGREEERMLNLTRQPACASLLEPRREAWEPYLDPAQVDVVRRVPLKTVSLDDYLPSAGIRSVDFIEVDTQGTELDILHGAERFLRETVIGLRVEVEFIEMYEGQPLFADVDAYLRDLGFVLFDLSRHRFRRRHYPPAVKTRGQLIYGHALYLRDWRAGGNPDRRLVKLAALAALSGFPDYALEVIDGLLERQGEIGAAGREALLQAKEECFGMRGSAPLKALVALDSSFLRRPLRAFTGACRRLGEAHKYLVGKGKEYWAD